MGKKKGKGSDTEEEKCLTVKYYLLKNNNQFRKELLSSDGLLLLEPQQKKLFENIDNCDILVCYYSLLDEKLFGRFKIKSTPQKVETLIDKELPANMAF